ncbi:MAG TPA: asparagine synthase C-terminal domain-containing protein [Thermoanaerobaculia bacterium]|nr:asparagine synthase C-terminal domain-containing protein [Thermoanaerobaculia bacterium]
MNLPDDDAYADAFREIFARILTGYPTSEPVGITLTSGMDSTTVAAMLRLSSPNLQMTAFSWVAPEIPKSDEGPATALVAERLECPMVPIYADQHWPLRREPSIRPSRASPAFLYYTDLWEETFDTVRDQGIRHLFSGVSGDHLFGGNVYSYADLLLTGRWTRLMRDLQFHLGFTQIGARGILRKMILGPLVRSVLINSKPWPAVPWLNPQYETLRQHPVSGPRNLLPGRRQRLDLLRDPLLPQVICLINELAEKHGITVLHPLLDHRLIEFAASLPTEQTFSAGVRKVILRRAMRGLLPDSTLDRREKIYPNGIAERGLRERETAKAWALMTNMRAAEMGFVNEARLREEYQRYLDGKTQSALFWHTLTLEAWLRLYF